MIRPSRPPLRVPARSAASSATLSSSVSVLSWIAGSKATSSVTVDKGGGDVAGGQYVLKVSDTGATVVGSRMRWVS